MLIIRIRMNRLFSLLLAGFLVLALGSEWGVIPVSAAPKTMPLQQAVPGGPSYLMIPAIAFQPEKPTDAYTIFWGELSVPQSSPNAFTYFYAPVNLPQGAHLTGLTMYYRDSNADAYTLGVDFYRKLLPSSSSGELVGLSIYSNLTGLSQYQSDTTPEPTRAVIDNSQYAYWLSLYIYASPVYLQLQAVRVDYTFGTNFPLINR